MKNKLKYTPSLILILTTVFAGLLLAAPHASAESDGPYSADAVVTVDESCSFDSDYSYTSTFTVLNGTAKDTESDTSKPTVGVTCNNSTGFSVKAIGYSPDATHTTGNDGNTDMFMTGGTATSPVIPTGAGSTNTTFAVSAPSFWGMRVDPTTVTSSTSYTINATYNTSAHTYAAVPSSATTVVHYAGSPSTPVTGTLRTDYGFYVSQAQAAGTYTGKVKYTIIGD